MAKALVLIVELFRKFFANGAEYRYLLQFIICSEENVIKIIIPTCMVWIQHKILRPRFKKKSYLPPTNGSNYNPKEIRN